MAKYDPREVTVQVMGNGFYIAREKDGEPIFVPSPATFDDIHDWILNLDDTELEAALQMYYDRWTFQSGQKDDRMALEALEAERARRKDDRSSWAPGIFK